MHDKPCAGDRDVPPTRQKPKQPSAAPDANFAAPLHPASSAAAAEAPLTTRSARGNEVPLRPPCDVR